MKQTKKESCKDDVRMILENLESLLSEVQKSNTDIFSLEDAPLYSSIKSFAEMLHNEYNYGYSTARDALVEMERAGEIIKSHEGYYTSSNGAHSQNIINSIASQMYATILPNVHSIYIEVPDNMAHLLEKSLNNYVARNDKRFYTVAHNLLLLLDLEIPSESSVFQKAFCLESLLEQHGIKLRDYNISNTEITGYSLDTWSSMQAEEEYRKQFEENSSSHGIINNRNMQTIKISKRN